MRWLRVGNWLRPVWLDSALPALPGALTRVALSLAVLPEFDPELELPPPDLSPPPRLATASLSGASAIVIALIITTA